MSKVVTGNDLGKKLCKLFNLPEYTVSFDLHVALDEIVAIDCKYYLNTKDAAAIDLVTAKFELKEVFEDTDYKPEITPLVEE